MCIARKFARVKLSSKGHALCFVLFLHIFSMVLQLAVCLNKAGSHTSCENRGILPLFPTNLTSLKTCFIFTSVNFFIESLTRAAVHLFSSSVYPSEFQWHKVKVQEYLKVSRFLYFPKVFVMKTKYAMYSSIEAFYKLKCCSSFVQNMIPDKALCWRQFTFIKLVIRKIWFATLNDGNRDIL